MKAIKCNPNIRGMSVNASTSIAKKLTSLCHTGELCSPVLGG